MFHIKKIVKVPEISLAAASYNDHIATKLFTVFSYAPCVGIFMWKTVLNFFKLWVSQ